MNKRFLLALVLFLPAASAAQTIGSRVHAVGAVCARPDTLGAGPGTCGTGGTLRTSGDKGTITGGPAGGTTKWGLSWFVHYDTAPDGWSTAKYLAPDTLLTPATGGLNITTATTGAGAPAQYTLTVQGVGGTILANGQTTITGLRPAAFGADSVRLIVTPNCTVAGTNPRPVVIVSSVNGGVAFIVTCTAVTPPPLAGFLVRGWRLDSLAIPVFAGTYTLTLTDSLGVRTGRLACTVTP